MNDFDCTVLQMRMFLAAADRGSFQEAAQTLYVEQSTFSRRISALEESLGFPLFDRSARPVRLTAEGTLLAGAWRDILERLDESCAQAKALRHSGSPRLSVCTVDSGNIQAQVAETARTLSDQVPELRLSLMYAGLSHWKDLLLLGEIDVYLTAEFETAELDRCFVSQKLQTFPKLACLHTGNPLAGRSSIPVEALRDMEFLDLDERSSPEHPAYVRALCRRHGFEPRFAPPVPNPHSVPMALRRKDQVYICDRLFRGYNTPPLTSVPLEQVSSGLYAVYLAKNQNPYIPQFTSCLRARLEEASPQT